MQATFYILYSKIFDKYYVGHTEDEIESRIRKHNSITKDIPEELTIGNSFTAKDFPPHT